MSKKESKKWFSNGLAATEAKKLGPLIGQITQFSIELQKEEGLQMNVGLKLQDGQEVEFRGGNAHDIEQIMVLTHARANFHMRNKFVEVYMNGSVKGLGVSEVLDLNPQR